jgi:hypothetical protein
MAGQLLLPRTVSMFRFRSTQLKRGPHRVARHVAHDERDRCMGCMPSMLVVA